MDVCVNQVGIGKTYYISRIANFNMGLVGCTNSGCPLHLADLIMGIIRCNARG